MADFGTDVHARTRYSVHIKINGECAAKKRWLRGILSHVRTQDSPHIRR